MVMISQSGESDELFIEDGLLVENGMGISTIERKTQLVVAQVPANNSGCPPV